MASGKEPRRGIAVVGGVGRVHLFFGALSPATIVLPRHELTRLSAASASLGWGGAGGLLVCGNTETSRVDR